MPARTDPYDDELDELPPPEPVHYVEQALLGALLLDPQLLPAIGTLEAEHFGNHTHSVLFAAMHAIPPPDPRVHAKEPPG
ncbi:DnaB-like helicase N-terminal domain-containing protein [Streptomyces sp. NPDC020096]